MQSQENSHTQQVLLPVQDRCRNRVSLLPATMSSSRSDGTDRSQPQSVASAWSAVGTKGIALATPQLRRPYRGASRQTPTAKEERPLVVRRFSRNHVLDQFLGEHEVFECCTNHCIGQLLGENAFRRSLPAEESEQRESFIDAVIATRHAVHDGKQTESADRLIARLRMGFTLGHKAVDFAPGYRYPQTRTSKSKQEYWWRLESGPCVQVGVAPRR